MLCDLMSTPPALRSGKHVFPVLTEIPRMYVVNIILDGASLEGSAQVFSTKLDAHLWHRRMGAFVPPLPHVAGPCCTSRRALLPVMRSCATICPEATTVMRSCAAICLEATTALRSCATICLQAISALRSCATSYLRTTNPLDN